MEAMSFKKLRAKLDHKKKYFIEYKNKKNNFVSTITKRTKMIKKMIVRLRMWYADVRGHHGKRWDYEPGDWYMGRHKTRTSGLVVEAG